MSEKETRDKSFYASIWEEEMDTTAMTGKYKKKGFEVKAPNKKDFDDIYRKVYKDSKKGDK